MEGGEKGVVEGWSDRRNLVSVGKNPLSPRMALGDGDKYNRLNEAVIERACI